MEATGSYWKPVWNVLMAGFDLILANAAHIKAVPSRKTDVNDAMWIADLATHGLIRPSFVPNGDIQARRDLTRTRKQLVRERASHVNRIDKVLQTANIKLSSVLSDIVGLSGRAILDKLAEGETNPAILVLLVHRNVRAPRAKIVESLRGRLTSCQLFLLKVHLGQLDAIDAAVAQIDVEVGERLRPFREAVEHLVTIPGVAAGCASVIVSEIGVDMSRFPTAAPLISWAGLCPKNDESAGKRRSTRLRKGAPWLKTVLVQCAWAARNAKGTYLNALFRRLRGRRGPRKAIMAVAAAMLSSIYHMLKNNVGYRDLGPGHFNHIDRTRKAMRAMRDLDALGFDVTIVDRCAA